MILPVITDANKAKEGKECIAKELEEDAAGVAVA
jgi:hypothetical protein